MKRQRRFILLKNSLNNPFSCTAGFGAVHGVYSLYIIQCFSLSNMHLGIWRLMEEDWRCFLWSWDSCRLHVCYNVNNNADIKVFFFPIKITTLLHAWNRPQELSTWTEGILDYLCRKTRCSKFGQDCVNKSTSHYDMNQLLSVQMFTSSFETSGIVTLKILNGKYVKSLTIL